MRSNAAKKSTASVSDFEVTADDLIAFEKEISELFFQKKIAAPVHLADGNESQLLEIFKDVKPTDWVFSAWRSHYHALLHGISKEWLKAMIVAGKSIAINCPEKRFYSSAIVGGTLPIALGAAKGLQLLKSPSTVWVFVGDMTAETGAFHEAVKYAEGHDLPIRFIIEDNGVCIASPTQASWGKVPAAPRSTAPYQVSAKVWRYHYIKSKYPHVGCDRWVTF